MGTSENDETSKSIRQLGLLSILSKFDKEVIKEANSKLLTDIVSGEENRRTAKVHRRQPLRFLKRIREKYKNLSRQIVLVDEEAIPKAVTKEAVSLAYNQRATHQEHIPIEPLENPLVDPTVDSNERGGQSRPIRAVQYHELLTMGI